MVCLCSISFDAASNDSWLRFARPVTRILATVNATRNKLFIRVVQLTVLKSRREHWFSSSLLMAAHTFANGLFGAEQTCACIVNTRRTHTTTVQIIPTNGCMS